MPGKEVLKVEDLRLTIGEKEVLRGLNLSIKKGETVVLFGPNGAGKSSLLYVLLGFPGYRIKSEKIIFKNKDITRLPVNERVKLGMGIAFQNPPSIRGIKLREMLRICQKNISETQTAKLSRKLNMGSFLDRDVNLGFSGGEAKRAELLQVLAQKPDLVCFDEPDSGVDVENVELLGKEIDSYLKKKTGIVITHQGYILQFVKATRGCILYNGKIICSGNPRKILHAIRKKGYAGCAICKHRMKS